MISEGECVYWMHPRPNSFWKSMLRATTFPHTCRYRAIIVTSQGGAGETTIEDEKLAKTENFFLNLM